MADSVLVFKIILATILLRIEIQAAPTELQAELKTKNCDTEESDGNSIPITIDQQQDGTGNVRLNIKDVIIFWVPTLDKLMFDYSGLALMGLLEELSLPASDFDSENPQNVEDSELEVTNPLPVVSPGDEHSHNFTTKPAHLVRNTADYVEEPVLKEKQS